MLGCPFSLGTAFFVLKRQASAGTTGEAITWTTK